jgi:hypothetical protein
MSVVFLEVVLSPCEVKAKYVIDTDFQVVNVRVMIVELHLLFKLLLADGDIAMLALYKKWPLTLRRKEATTSSFAFW